MNKVQYKMLSMMQFSFANSSKSNSILLYARDAHETCEPADHDAFEEGGESEDPKEADPPGPEDVPLLLANLMYTPADPRSPRGFSDTCRYWIP